MIKKLPLTIRQHYSTKVYKDNWLSQCDTCGHQIVISKPAKGQQVSNMQIQHLMEHIDTHLTVERELSALKHYKVLTYQQGDFEVAQLPMVDNLYGNPQMQAVGDGFIIDLLAANRRHARIVAQGMLDKVQSANRPHRRTWRDRFPQKE